jgi:3-dehydroquinate synthetase
MAMAAGLSEKLGGHNECAPRICALLKKLGMPCAPPPIGADAFIESMKLDKKVSGGRIRFILASGIGKVFLQEVGEDVLREFLSAGAGC